MYKAGGATTTSERGVSFTEQKTMNSAITSIGVDISIVENLNNVFLLLPGHRVHLEISSDEKLTRHSSDN